MDLEAPILVPTRVSSWGTRPRMTRAPCDATCITFRVHQPVLVKKERKKEMEEGEGVVAGKATSEYCPAPFRT